MRAKKIRILLFSCAFSLLSLFSANVFADAGMTNVTTSSDLSITLHGFVDSTFFWQNQNFTFGNGQNAEWTVPTAAGTSNDLSGGDLRNTRLWIDITGGKLGDSDWVAGAHIEGDFFGGNNGTGAFSSQQDIPRMRQAYVTLNNGSGSSWKIGQQWSLLFQTDNVPESDAHIAFPLGYGTGIIGWRFPGAVYSQELSQSEGTDWRLDLGAFAGSWNGPGSTINFDTAANADFRPQVEARLHVQSSDTMWYLVAHYSTEDLTGVGGTAVPPAAGNSITTYAYEGGVNWHPGSWVLHAGIYDGKGLGENFGAMAQFGDISEWGGFAQAGYKFTPDWGLYAIYTTVRPNQGDVVTWVGPKAATTAYLKNQDAGLDLLYNNGPWGFGFEWLHAITRYTNSPTAATTAATVGDQISASAIFRF
jgi:hypothetical protein